MTTTATALPDHDQALLARWQAGDEPALAELLRRHAGLVHRSCRRQLGAADADDATQAVFLVLARKAKLAAAAPVLEAWLLAVARRVCGNAARARRRRLRHEQESAAMEAASQRDQGLPPELPIELSGDLDEAIAALPAHEREAIAAHYLGGISQADLARRCNCPEGTVRARVTRGVQRLRDWFSKRGRGTTTGAVLAILLAEHGAAAAEAGAATANLLVGTSGLTPTGSGALAAPSAPAQAWSQATIWNLTMIKILPYAAGLGLVALATTTWSLFAADAPEVRPPAAHALPLSPPAVAGQRAVVPGGTGAEADAPPPAPAIDKVREMANRQKSGKNLFQVYGTLLAFETDQHTIAETLAELVDTESMSPKVLISPSAPGIANPYLYIRSIEDVAAAVPLLIEDPACYAGKGCLVCFGDGHLKFIEAPDAQRLWAEAQRLAASPTAAAGGITTGDWVAVNDILGLAPAAPAPAAPGPAAAPGHPPAAEHAL